MTRLDVETLLSYLLGIPAIALACWWFEPVRDALEAAEGE